MSLSLTGVVEEVTLVGPKTVQSEGKNKGKTFHIHQVKVLGKSFSQFDFRQKPVPPCLAGDNVNLVFTETNGQTKDGKPIVNRTLNSVAVLDAASQHREQILQQQQNPQQEQSAFVTSTPPLGQGDTQNITVATKTPLVSKDTSMEVSGLLQALLQSNLLEENPTKSVEDLLKELLRVKRKVAQELEQNGTV